MKPTIIFQDESILVLAKPPGWIVNEAATTTDQPVVQKWLGEMKYPLSGSRLLRSGIVHRLDKETSGILLVAKTQDAFENLQAQFKAKKVTKSYLALLHGRLKQAEGAVEAAVGRLPWRRDRFGVLPGGREAKTSYKTLGVYKKGSEVYTLAEAFPETGRTHQIRIHFKYLGNPVVSDEFYAGRKTARGDRLWCPRLFLHAKSISFSHPETGVKKSFSLKLPGDLEGALGALEKLRETT